jgi:hypothetical protein
MDEERDRDGKGEITANAFECENVFLQRRGTTTIVGHDDGRPSYAQRKYITLDRQ